MRFRDVINFFMAFTVSYLFRHVVLAGLGIVIGGLEIDVMLACMITILRALREPYGMRV